MSDQNLPEPGEALPKARTKKNWKTYLFWLIPLGASLLAGWFVYTEVFKGGPKLHIEFHQAVGLEPGKSQLKYRGVTIGSVETVELTKDHSRVKVTVSLHESAESIAREGSIFWIVKPRVGLDQLRGLQTIVSGDYITVEPGAGKRQTEFKGLSEPPVVEAKEATIKFVLLAGTLSSVEKRTPLLYRGINIGEVSDYDLGPESQSVRITVAVKKHYAPLIRMNSKFWNASGINLKLGLTGIDLDMQSMKSLATSGIAVATPDVAEKAAPADTTFRLYDKAEDQWLGWAPSIRLHGHGS